jgi:hypothetical protein
MLTDGVRGQCVKWRVRREQLKIFWHLTLVHWQFVFSAAAPGL